MSGVSELNELDQQIAESLAGLLTTNAKLNEREKLLVTKIKPPKESPAPPEPVIYLDVGGPPSSPPLRLPSLATAHISFIQIDFIYYYNLFGPP